jgi:lipoate-protein ligase A
MGPPDLRRPWRLVDTGLRPAVQNLALTRAMQEVRAGGAVANALRFFSSEPAAVVGCSQSVAQELDVDQCRRESIAIERAADSSPARFVDPRQLGWELMALRSDYHRRDAQGIAHRIAQTVCDALGQFGIDARPRAGCEVEVDGRRIGDLRVSIDGAFALCQGLVFVDFDPARAERILRSALGRAALPGAARPVPFRMEERVTSLREQLGLAPSMRQVRRALVEAFMRAFGFRLVHGDLTEAEQARYRIALREFRAPDWVGLIRRPSAEMPIVAASARRDRMTMHAGVAYDLRGRRLREACLSVEPQALSPRLLRDLEAAIRGVPLDSLSSTVRGFFVARQDHLRGLSAEDFTALVMQAVLRPERVLSG